MKCCRDIDRPVVFVIVLFMSIHWLGPFISVLHLKQFSRYPTQADRMSERETYLAVDLVVAALLRHTDRLVLQLQMGGGGRDGHRSHRGELRGRQRQRRHPHRTHRDLQQPTHLFTDPLRPCTVT